MELIKDLGVLEDYVWAALGEALREDGHPWRTPAIGTVREGRAQLRTVVLRAADRQARQVTCYADHRSAKLEELAQSPRLSWLFYDTRRLCQLRMEGHIQLAGEDERRAAWETFPVFARKVYASERPPGAPLPAPGDDLPEAFFERSLPETDAYFSNFVILHTIIDRMDWLQLDREAHHRAGFNWRDGQWEASWLVP
jgi:pyridoxine/pyridoxamine 5'-phosphate oxidase